MSDLEKARKDLYFVMETGNQNEILKASKLLDVLIVSYMSDIKIKKKVS